MRTETRERAERQSLIEQGLELHLFWHRFAMQLQREAVTNQGGQDMQQTDRGLGAWKRRIKTLERKILL